MADKPAILQDQEFTLEEGAAYRLFSRLAIWMNKLLFSTLFLLLVWLLWGAATGAQDCTETIKTIETNNTTVDAGTRLTCSVFLTHTSLFLAAMAVVSFVAQVAFGMLGLIVGKRLVPKATAARDEVGAGRDQVERGPDATGPDGASGADGPDEEGR